MNILKKHDILNKKRQFLTKELGQEKLEKVIAAVEKLIETENITLTQLTDVTQYLHTDSGFLLPTQKA